MHGVMGCAGVPIAVGDRHRRSHDPRDRDRSLGFDVPREVPSLLALFDARPPLVVEAVDVGLYVVPLLS